MFKAIAKVKTSKGENVSQLTTFEMSKEKIVSMQERLEKEKTRLGTINANLKKQLDEWNLNIKREENDLADRLAFSAKAATEDGKTYVQAKGHTADCKCSKCDQGYTANIKNTKKRHYDAVEQARLGSNPYSENAIHAIERLIGQAKQFRDMVQEDKTRNAKLLKKVKDSLYQISIIQDRLRSVDLDIEVVQMLKKRNAALYAKSNPMDVDNPLLDMESISREVQTMQYSTEALLELGRNA